MFKYQRLVNALEDGQELTAKQIRARYKIENPAAVIFYLRKDGYPIYLNDRKGYDGSKLKKYRLGTPRQSAHAF